MPITPQTIDSSKVAYTLQYLLYPPKYHVSIILHTGVGVATAEIVVNSFVAVRVQNAGKRRKPDEMYVAKVCHCNSTCPSVVYLIYSSDIHAQIESKVNIGVYSVTTPLFDPIGCISSPRWPVQPLIHGGACKCRYTWPEGEEIFFIHPQKDIVAKLEDPAVVMIGSRVSVEQVQFSCSKKMLQLEE